MIRPGSPPFTFHFSLFTQFEYALHHLLQVPPRARRRGQSPGSARPARRLPAPVGIRRRVAVVLARRGERGRTVARLAAAGDPPRPDGLRAADRRHAEGAARRLHRRCRAGPGAGAGAERAARPHRAAADRRRLSQRRPATPGAAGLPVHVRARRPGALGRAAGAVQPDREGHRLSRLQDAEEPARQRGQVELRRARHPLPRHRRGGRRGEQALRVRRRAEPRRPGDAHQRDRPRRAGRADQHRVPAT